MPPKKLSAEGKEKTYQVPIRVTAEVRKRLRVVCFAREERQNDFILRAVMAALEEAEKTIGQLWKQQMEEAFPQKPPGRRLK